MARSITEIYDSMIAEKQNMATLQQLQPHIDNHQTLLNDLTSQSKVAVWRLFYFTIAVAIWSVEKLFDLHKEEVQELIQSAIPGTKEWYRQQALLFQYGDNLIWQDNKFKYPENHPDKQVVKHAAVVEQNGIVIIKTATENNTGERIPLDTLQFSAFQSYMKKIKFAGTKINFINDLPDKLQIYYRVYYDPLVMQPDGSLIDNPNTKPVEEAILNYIKNLPFNGRLNITALTDVIQKAEGVIDPVFEQAHAQYGTYPYQPIIDNYTAHAGYMKIDDLYPLSDTITYVPYV